MEKSKPQAPPVNMAEVRGAIALCASCLAGRRDPPDDPACRVCRVLPAARRVRARG